MWLCFWQVDSTDLFNFGKMFPEMKSWHGEGWMSFIMAS